MSTGTITARPAADAGPAKAPRTAFVLAAARASGQCRPGWCTPCTSAASPRDLLAGTSAGAPERRVPRLPPPPTAANVGELAAIWRGLRRSDIFPLRPRMVGPGDHAVED